MTSAERKSIQNGIWLCKTCAKIIDSEPDAYPAEMLAVWKRHAEAGAVRDATATADQVGLLLADITAASELLLSFCAAWERNEPYMQPDFNAAFEERSARLMKHSSDRVNSYHKEVAPHVARILTIARYILGSDHQVIIELDRESRHASVNYIGMRECVNKLQELHSILQLR